MDDTSRTPGDNPTDGPADKGAPGADAGAVGDEPRIERRTSPARAVASAEPDTPGAASAGGSRGAGTTATGPGRGSSKRKAKFAVGGLVVVLAIAGLVVWAMTRSESTAFFMTVSEVVAGPPTGSPESFRVNGNVVPDTVERDGVETSFNITDGKSELTVVTDDALPDAFWSAYENDASNIEVIAQGSLDGTGSTFTASKVLAKCPSKFKTRA